MTRADTGSDLPLSSNSRASRSANVKPASLHAASLTIASPGPAVAARRAATFTVSPSAEKVVRLPGSDDDPDEGLAGVDADADRDRVRSGGDQLLGGPDGVLGLAVAGEATDEDGRDLVTE